MRWSGLSRPLPNSFKPDVRTVRQHWRPALEQMCANRSVWGGARCLSFRGRGVYFCCRGRPAFRRPYSSIACPSEAYTTVMLRMHSCMHDPYISYAHNTLIPVVAAGELAFWTVGTSGEWLKPNRSMSPPRRALGEVAAYVYIYNYSIVISTYIYNTKDREREQRPRERETE